MRRQRGFTLIELLVVIAIIAILATLVITQLAGAQTKARNSNAKSDISQAGKAIETWKVNNSTDYVLGSLAVSAGVPGTNINNTSANGGWGTIFKDVTNGYPVSITKTPSTAYTYGYTTDNTVGTVVTTIPATNMASKYCIATNVVSGVSNVTDVGFGFSGSSSFNLGAKDPSYGTGTCS